jgi:HEAT repeat protein
MTGAASIERDPARWKAWWANNQDNRNLERDLLAARAARLAITKQQMERVVIEAQARLAEVYQLLADKDKEGVLLKYLRANEPAMRVVGAQLVQDDFKQLRQPTPAVRNQLRMMIGDSASQVRVAVAQALFVLNDDQAIDALLQQVGREPDADVRIALARALVPMRDLRVVDPLIKLLADSSPAVVEVAATGLRDPDLAPLIQKDPALAQRVARALREALAKRPSSSGGVPLRAALVDAMGATRDPGMLETYRAIVQSRGEPVPVRAAALRALGQLGPAAGRASPADAIVGSLNDRDESIRLEAVRALRGTADIIYAEKIFDMLKPEREPNANIRDAAWEVLRNLFEQTNSNTLRSWADRALITQAPERHMEIYAVLLKRAIAQNDDDTLATVRQTIGEDQMKLSEAAARAGDAETAKERAKKAADLYFAPALDYYASKHPSNQATMITGALIERRMDALLAAAEYTSAAGFASDYIARDPANMEALGAKLKNEVSRLQKAGKAGDALKLIDAVNKMRTQIAGHMLDVIHAIERELRAPTPRSASGSNPQDAVGSGQ